MWEILTVLALYLIVSFLGMIALWTVAVRRGAVSAPRFFFWVSRVQTASTPPDIETALSNSHPFAQALATSVLASEIHSRATIRHMSSSPSVSNQSSYLNSFAAA
jgi:hypothetical protein